MLSIGDELQNFKILSLLGKGGMGEVYLGEDVHLNRRVAIKKLSHSLVYEEGFIQRFKREAQLHAQLKHTNIVDLYSFFQHDDSYYMVMEFAEGKTLSAMIKEMGPIPTQRSVFIVKQLLDALDYAHSMQIIHRDIKPSNIILGSNDHVKILDFGISKIMGERGLTSTGQAVGTIFYMSPEQVRAVSDLDGRSDIYSAGVTFFEMLSGRLPYNVDTESDFYIMEQIVNTNIPDPRKYYPSIPEYIVTILSKMLIKDRESRYSSAHDVIHDLENKNPIKPSPQYTPQIQRQTQTPNHQPVNLPQPDNIKTYLTQSILVTLFCCLPFGIVAIANSNKTTNAIKMGDYASAQKFSKTTKTWVWVSIWASIIIVIFSAISGGLG